MKTVNDLKQYLEEIISDLEMNYDGSEEMILIKTTS